MEKKPHYSITMTGSGAVKQNWMEEGLGRPTNLQRGWNLHGGAEFVAWTGRWRLDTSTSANKSLAEKQTKTNIYRLIKRQTGSSGRATGNGMYRNRLNLRQLGLD